MWVLGIVLIYMLILKITGHSPTETAIFGTALGVMATAIYQINYKLGNLIGENKEFKSNVKESFNKMKTDLEALKKK